MQLYADISFDAPTKLYAGDTYQSGYMLMPPCIVPAICQCPPPTKLYAGAPFDAFYMLRLSPRPTRAICSVRCTNQAIHRCFSTCPARIKRSIRYTAWAISRFPQPSSLSSHVLLRPMHLPGHMPYHFVRLALHALRAKSSGLGYPGSKSL